jgi:type I restriction enzyme M protein
LNEAEAREMVLNKLFDSALDILNDYLFVIKKEIIEYFENLWEKYGVSLIDLETMRVGMKKDFELNLEQLGYGK